MSSPTPPTEETNCHRPLPKSLLLWTVGLLTIAGLSATLSKPSVLIWEVTLRSVITMSLGPIIVVVGYYLQNINWWQSPSKKFLVSLILGALAGLATAWCLFSLSSAEKISLSTLGWNVFISVALSLYGSLSGNWALVWCGAWAMPWAVAVNGVIAGIMAGALTWSWVWATHKMCLQKYPWWQIQLFVGGAILGGFGGGVVLGKLFGA